MNRKLVYSNTLTVEALQAIWLELKKAYLLKGTYYAPIYKM